MNPGIFSMVQLAHLQPPAGRVILITGGLGDIAAEDLREEIRHSGWDCEIFQGDVSDRIQLGKQIREVLDRFHHVSLPVNDTGITSDCLIRKMTEEEWLAQ